MNIYCCTIRSSLRSQCLAGGYLPKLIVGIDARRSFSSLKNIERYHINYHTLKEAGILGDGADFLESGHNLTPETVKANVKNVVGWRGGAERGFLAAYPDCIHQITDKTPTQLVESYTKVLTHNLSSSVLGHRFGMLVPITYHKLATSTESNTSDNMKLAHVLGWVAELVRASHLATSELLGLGVKPLRKKIHEEESATHRLPSKGALNDALLLERSAFSLIQVNFHDADCYVHLIETVLESMRINTMGRALMLKLTTTPEVNDLSKYGISMYKMLLRQNYTHVNYIMPMCLALHFAGYSKDKVIQQATYIMDEIAYLVEVTGDFANCYYNREGTDIEDGRLTWLIVNAYARANPAQKVVLQECYGVSDPNKVNEVRRIYEELKLQKMCSTVIEKSRADITDHIQQISSLGNAGLSSKFFFQLLDNMELSYI